MSAAAPRGDRRGPSQWRGGAGAPAPEQPMSVGLQQEPPARASRGEPRLDSARGDGARGSRWGRGAAGGSWRGGTGRSWDPARRAPRLAGTRRSSTPVYPGSDYLAGSRPLPRSARLGRELARHCPGRPKAGGPRSAAPVPGGGLPSFSPHHLQAAVVGNLMQWGRGEGSHDAFTSLLPHVNAGDRLGRCRFPLTCVCSKRSQLYTCCLWLLVALKLGEHRLRIRSRHSASVCILETAPWKLWKGLSAKRVDAGESEPGQAEPGAPLDKNTTVGSLGRQKTSFHCLITDICVLNLLFSL